MRASIPEFPIGSVSGRFWRMLRIRYFRDPLSGEGARLYGGRWNRPGCPALYMARTHATAIAEFHQDVVVPGTLVAYDVESARIADLAGDGYRERPEIEDAITAQWLRIARLEGRDPSSWTIADRLIDVGCDGALVPSAQSVGGINLVLWRWSADGSAGATVTAIDPYGELSPR